MSSISAGGLGDFSPVRRKTGRISFHLEGGGSKLASEPFAPDDVIAGQWSRERLIKMNARFCAAMVKAIERGLERRPGEGRERAA
jgi:hypothetical protein